MEEEDKKTESVKSSAENFVENFSEKIPEDTEEEQATRLKNSENPSGEKQPFMNQIAGGIENTPDDVEPSDLEATMPKEEADPLFCMNEIFEELANGGSLINWAKDKGVKYSAVINWIHDDEKREERYNKALSCRGEYVVQRILDELNSIGFADIRGLYSPGGNLLPPSEWPDDIARAVAGLDITDAKTDEKGNEITPEVKKIKTWDKLRALEMAGKNLKMFTDRHEVTTKMTLEELVIGSFKDKEEGDTDAVPENGKKDEQKEDVATPEGSGKDA